MEFKPGNIVRSKAGHDKGDIFFVLSVEGTRALLIDGKSRRSEKPKQKSLRHITLVKESVGELSDRLKSGDRVLASEVRKKLSAIAENDTE